MSRFPSVNRAKSTADKEGGARRGRIVFLSGLVPVALTAIFAVYRPAFIPRLDDSVYDVVMRSSSIQPPGKRVVIVDIDERSLMELGQWPWRRDVVGELVTRLRDLSTNAAILWRRRASVALIAAIGAACISPQLVIYKRTTGHWIVNAYIHGGFTFASPHLLDVLFSVQKGLFFWSPALALAVPGFFVARGACRRLALPVALIVAVHTYVVASWIVWYYGASYGHRAFTDTLGLLAAFIASFFAWVADRPRAAVMVAVATSAAVVLSVLQMIQYWNGVMPSGGPTWSQYRALFLRFP